MPLADILPEPGRKENIMKRSFERKPVVTPVAAAFAALFFALPPYELTAHWYGTALLALTVLPACGMALLLGCFGRPDLTPFRRYLPAAAGLVALFFTYEALAESGTIWSSALLAAAPLGVALTVMPGVYFLIYRLERSVGVLRPRRGHCPPPGARL